MTNQTRTAAWQNISYACIKALLIAAPAYLAMETAHSAVDLYIRIASEIGAYEGEEF